MKFELDLTENEASIFNIMLGIAADEAAYMAHHDENGPNVQMMFELRAAIAAKVRKQLVMILYETKPARCACPERSEGERAARVLRAEPMP